MEHFSNLNYKQLDLHASQNLCFEFKDLNYLTFYGFAEFRCILHLYLLLFAALLLDIFIVLLSSNLHKSNF